MPDSQLQTEAGNRRQEAKKKEGELTHLFPPTSESLGRDLKTHSCAASKTSSRQLITLTSVLAVVKIQFISNVVCLSVPYNRGWLNLTGTPLEQL